MAPEIIPVLTGMAAGLAGGSYFENRARNQAEATQEVIVEALAAIMPESTPGSEPEKNHVARSVQWLGKRLVSVVAVPAMAAGSFAGLAYEQQTATENTPPTLELVVDHSGATALPPHSQPNTQPVVSEINRIVAQFGSTDGIKSEVILSSHNTNVLASTHKTIQDAPWGQSSMDKATTLALSRTAQVLPISDGHHMSRNAAVFVITNGNSAGSAEEVSQAAHAQGNTPVYIVNVEGDSQSSTVQNLQNIAKETGGHYWSAKQANLATVTESVKQTITSYSRPSHNEELSIFYGSLSALFLAGSAVAYRIRKQLAIHKNISIERR